MAEQHDMTWRLSDPGMDLLERAGLAGLYMALRAADEEEADLSPLIWSESDLRPDSITVHWSEPAKPAFERLMEWAWQVRDGVLYFPAVHSERERVQWWHRVPMHNGILSSFLQHVNVQPRLDFENRIVNVSDDQQLVFSYAPPAERVNDEERGINPKTKRLYQKKVPTNRLYPVKQCPELFDGRSQQFKTKPIRLSNWVYPGIAGRYSHEASWEGPAQIAVLLMLAPTVCMYQRLQGDGNNYVVVIPDVRDLEEFGEARQRLNLDTHFTDVASLGDAGLQFHAEYSSRNPRRRLASGCRVVAMGYVRYYQGQSIRKSVLDITADLGRVCRYRLLHRELPNMYVALRPEAESANRKPVKTRKTAPSKKQTAKPPSDLAAPRASGFIKIPAARARIADNLVSGRPWYENLLIPHAWDRDEMEKQRKRQPGTSIDRLWFQALYYQRGKLMKLIQEDDMWDFPEQERAFVDAFQDTLRALYRKEIDEAQKAGWSFNEAQRAWMWSNMHEKLARERGAPRSPNERMQHLNEDVRRSLMQAKTHILLRKELLEFFSKPIKYFRSQTLVRNPDVIWKLVDTDWRKGRDLAFLALVTYRATDKREESDPSDLHSDAAEKGT